jgi:lipopolysaccharide/colanic/teichoic acid biosynthesis glycosyltransferase
VIFKQYRIGENGRRFKCYKFRTMSLDAESRKQDLLPANQMSGPMFKLRSDPRVFPFGVFLRRTSLDELPQFFNILRGDMSLVGTRPPTPEEVVQYEMHFRRRLSIRPGLTGLWQVSGRSQITKFEQVLELDLEYIDRWSIWLDFKILFRTLWMVVGRRGAY